MTQSMYRTLLGEAFDVLPEAVRAMHAGVNEAAGRGTIKRGPSLLARMICAIMKAPNSGEDAAVRMVFSPTPLGERWIRSFNGESFETELRIASRAPDAQVTERFGVLRFRLRVAAHRHGVDLIPEGVSVLGLPLPRFLCPEAIGMERVREGKYHFDVTVRFPLAGEVLSYSGWLEPAAAP